MKQKGKVSLLGKVLRWVIILIISPFLIVYLIIIKIKKRKIAKINDELIGIYNISQVDLLGGVEFEQFLKEVFINFGYSVTETSATHDYGADLVVRKNNTVTVVQAKRYNNTVGAHALQEVLGAKNHYSANQAMVITNSYFTAEAKQLASENAIMLVDREELISLIKKLNVKIMHKNCYFSAMSASSVSEIEGKYKYWI